MFMKYKYTWPLASHQHFIYCLCPASLYCTLIFYSQSDWFMCVCVTHKVLSLGMWLKLDTGMLLMLLLFSVLQNMNEKFITDEWCTVMNSDGMMSVCLAEILTKLPGRVMLEKLRPQCSWCDSCPTDCKTQKTTTLKQTPAFFTLSMWLTCPLTGSWCPWLRGKPFEEWPGWDSHLGLCKHKQHITWNNKWFTSELYCTSK